MNYLDFLSSWSAGWSIDRQSGVQIQLHTGPERGLSSACWLGAESELALGSLTVWTDGAIEVEVMSLPRQERFHVYSGVLTGHDELTSRLNAFVTACAGPLATPELPADHPRRGQS